MKVFQIYRSYSKDNPDSEWERDFPSMVKAYIDGNNERSYGRESGALETLDEKISRCSEMIGMFFKVAMENRIPTREELKEFIPNNWEIRE